MNVAVTEAFIRFYNDGLIFRNNRLVNWDCKLKTAMSDLEVDYITVDKPMMIAVPTHDGARYEFGVLHHFAYPLEAGGELVVATTRLETMLGDTAVAVHPEDPRFSHHIGSYCIHPFNGRKIPIIGDDILVDMNFGTGCVKVTPAHDPNDFEVGTRHSLQFINLLDDEGLFNENGGEFKGMRRFDVRKLLVTELEKKGLFRGVTPNPMRLGISSRTKDIIEPLIRPQWFVNCSSMAKASVEAVEKGDLKIQPEAFKTTWYSWLNNIRDWCISRQLWWGHRIPAYRVTVEGEPAAVDPKDEVWVVGRSEAEALEAARLKRSDIDPSRISIQQDEDVLDTWFSSALFPFSTLGWPNEKAEDFLKFFPGDVLETGHDILFFWVARMVMTSLHLTGKLPFHTIYLHAIIRDAHGRKMSKSLGNIIDPLDVISGVSLDVLHKQLDDNSNIPVEEVAKAKEGQKKDFPAGISECGTDALRFALCQYTSQARDINLDINRVVGYRQFCNKLWNATKFALSYLDGYVPEATSLTGHESDLDKWILSRLNTTCANCDAAWKVYDFSTVTNECYQFVLYQFCDVYLEMTKTVLRDGSEDEKQAVRHCLYVCCDGFLRLLHPFMCFVTEELWQRLPRTPTSPESIMIATYPLPRDEWRFEQAEATTNVVIDIIKACRSTKSEYKLLKNSRPALDICVSCQEEIDALSAFVNSIAYVAQIGNVTVKLSDGQLTPGCIAAPITTTVSMQLHLKDVVNVEEELEKLAKEVASLEKAIAAQEKAQATPTYERIPVEVREQNAKTQNERIHALEHAKMVMEGFRKL